MQHGGVGGIQTNKWFFYKNFIRPNIDRVNVILDITKSVAGPIKDGPNTRTTKLFDRPEGRPAMTTKVIKLARLSDWGLKYGL
jgi:hypothetical protein